MGSLFHLTELNITRFDHYAHGPLYAGQTQLGPDACPETWANCQAAAERESDFCADEAYRPDVEAHFGSYGGWAPEELAAMTWHNLRALLIQDAACALSDFAAGEDLGRVYFDSDPDYPFLHFYVGP